MTITAISDLHGHLDINVPQCDVLCICGDIVPLDIQSYTKHTLHWLKNVFIPWCNTLQCDEILLIGGNHDIKIAEHEQEVRKLFTDTKIHYLLDESYEHIDINEGHVIKFYGTPWCHIFGNWAFMISDEAIAEKLSNMPDDIDVLLTHDAPYGTSDVCMQDVYWNRHEHIGNHPLRDIILMKKPKYCLHGHLHSTNHECEMLENTKVYNVSVLDERYTVAYEPLTINI